METLKKIKHKKTQKNQYKYILQKQILISFNTYHFSNSNISKDIFFLYLFPCQRRSNEN